MATLATQDNELTPEEAANIFNKKRLSREPIINELSPAEAAKRLSVKKEVVELTPAQASKRIHSNKMTPSVMHPTDVKAFQGGSPGDPSGASADFDYLLWNNKLGRGLHNIWPYLKGDLPGIPQAVKETYKQLPELMYKPGVEYKPQQTMNLAMEGLGLSKVPGIKAAIKKPIGGLKEFEGPIFSKRPGQVALRYEGYQPGFGDVPGFEQWSVLEAGLHNKVGTLSRKGMEDRLGIDIPPTPKNAIPRKTMVTANPIQKTGAKPKEVKVDPIQPEEITAGMPKETMPKYAQSINLERQAISNKAKEIELKMAGDKKTVTHGQTIHQSDDILADLKKTNESMKRVKGITVGDGLATDITVARQVNVDAIVQLRRLADDVADGRVSVTEYNRAFLEVKENVFKAVSEGSSEIGRALNAHKIMLAETGRLSKVMSQMEKGMSKNQIERLSKLNIDDPLEMANFAKTIDDPKFKDLFLEFWYNSILSAPTTHIVNIGSNTLWSSYQIPHRAHVGLWDKIFTSFTGRPRQIFMSETVPLMAGYKTGFKRGYRSAKDVMRTGKLQEFETKWAQEMGIPSVGAWARSPNRYLRAAAPYMSAPTKALRAMDVWANSIAYDGQMNALARRASKQKGLKGDKRKAFETAFKKNPPESAHQEAMKFSKHSTFMDDPDQFSAWFLGLRKVPVIGPASQILVPFVNTIGNLTKRGMELTPGIGIIKESVSRGMGRGSPTAEVMARQVEGAILTAYILYKADMGDITTFPRSKAELNAWYRDGKMPWGIKVGDNWYSYRRIEPFNTAIASVAQAYDKIKNAPDEATATQIFADTIVGVKDNILTGSYLQGLNIIFNKYGTKLSEAPQKFAGTLVPYSSFWRSMNRAYEQATEGKVTVKEKGGGWLQTLSQTIPLLSGTSPDELNVWGEEKIIPGNIFRQWLPWKWSTEGTDPVESMLQTLDKYPSLPHRTFKHFGKEYTFDADIYRNYSLDFGNKAKKRMDKLTRKPLMKKRLADKAKHPMILNSINNALKEVRDETNYKAVKEQLKREKERRQTPRRNF